MPSASSHRPRRSVVAAAASAGALAAVALAAAASGAVDAKNLITVKGRGLPYGSGSPTKPLAKDLSFSAEIHPPGGVIVAPLERYRVVIQGGRVFPKIAGRCTLAQASSADHATVCKRAKVGTGTIEVWYGVPGDPVATTPTCNLATTFYNTGTGLAIRLDVSPDPPCPVQSPPQNVLPGRFITPRLGGKPAGGIEFTVPPELRHIAGLTILVKRLDGRFRRIVGKARVAGRTRKVGYFSSIACQNRKQRLVEVSGVDENGRSYVARTRVRC